MDVRQSYGRNRDANNKRRLDGDPTLFVSISSVLASVYRSLCEMSGIYIYKFNGMVLRHKLYIHLCAKYSSITSSVSPASNNSVILMSDVTNAVSLSISTAGWRSPK